MPECLASFLEREHPIDHRPHLVQRDRSIHRLKSIAAPDHYSLYSDVLHQNLNQIYFGHVPGQVGACWCQSPFLTPSLQA